jgi:hypothetical protein
MARLLQRRNIEGRYRLSTTYLITAVLNRSAAQAIEDARVARPLASIAREDAEASIDGK